MYQAWNYWVPRLFLLYRIFIEGASFATLTLINSTPVGAVVLAVPLSRDWAVFGGPSLWLALIIHHVKPYHLIPPRSCHVVEDKS